MMTLPRLTSALLLPTLLLLPVLPGCDLGNKSLGNDDVAGDGDGDGTGDGDGDGDDELPNDTEGPGDGICGAESEGVIAGPDAALAGFDQTAADFIAIAVGEYLGTFDWYDNDGPITIAHAGTSSELSMSVSYEGGEIRLHEVENVGEFSNGDGPIWICSNVVEIDVVITFTTADGLFAETFEVPITVASHTEDGGVGVPGFSTSLDLDGFAGTLALADFEFTDAEITDLVLGGNFSDDTAGGGLSMEVETMDWVGFGGVAEFSTLRQP